MLNLVEMATIGFKAITAIKNGNADELQNLINNYKINQIPKTKKLSTPIGAVGGAMGAVYTAVVPAYTTVEVPIMFGMLSKTVSVVKAAAIGTYIFNICIGGLGGWTIGTTMDTILEMLDSRSERKMALFHDYRMKEYDGKSYAESYYKSHPPEKRQ